MGTVQVQLRVFRALLVSPKSDLARMGVRIARRVSTPALLRKGIVSFVLKATTKVNGHNLFVIPVLLVSIPIRQVRQCARNVQQDIETPSMAVLYATVVNLASIPRTKDKSTALTLFPGTTKIMKARPKPKSAPPAKFPLYMERMRVYPAVQGLINLTPARRAASNAWPVQLPHYVVLSNAPSAALGSTSLFPANWDAAAVRRENFLTRVAPLSVTSVASVLLPKSRDLVNA